VRYWGIIAIIEGRKIKVIIRKIGDNGALHFWSVVPAWTTNRYRDIEREAGRRLNTKIPLSKRCFCYACLRLMNQPNRADAPQAQLVYQRTGKGASGLSIPVLPPTPFYTISTGR